MIFFCPVELIYCLLGAISSNKGELDALNLQEILHLQKSDT